MKLETKSSTNIIVLLSVISAYANKTQAYQSPSESCISTELYMHVYCNWPCKEYTYVLQFSNHIEVPEIILNKILGNFVRDNLLCHQTRGFSHMKRLKCQQDMATSLSNIRRRRRRNDYTPLVASRSVIHIVKVSQEVYQSAYMLQ